MRFKTIAGLAWHGDCIYMGRPLSGSVRTLVALYDRAPKRYEVVHHKNGDPWDNAPENLEVLTRSEHAQRHAKERFEARYPRARDLALIM